MNNWKDLAKHGRFGDTMMKKIDGKPAHVNAVEYEMSPEYIKEHGSGTINPITGKKEYFLPILMAGLAIAGGVQKGIAAEQNRGNVAQGKAAAYDINQDKLDLLGDTKTVSDIYSGKQATSGLEELGFGTNMELRKTQAFGDQAYGKANLATSGTIEGKMQTQMADLMQNYKTSTQKIMDTRSLARSKSDLAFRSGEMSAEEAYQNTLTGLSATPTNFVEGFFS